MRLVTLAVVSPRQIISYAVWAYHRFCLSFRDVEDLLAERGILVSYETIQQLPSPTPAAFVNVPPQPNAVAVNWGLPMTNANPHQESALD